MWCNLFKLYRYSYRSSSYAGHCWVVCICKIIDSVIPVTGEKTEAWRGWLAQRSVAVKWWAHSQTQLCACPFLSIVIQNFLPHKTLVLTLLQPGKSVFQRVSCMLIGQISVPQEGLWGKYRSVTFRRSCHCSPECWGLWGFQAWWSGPSKLTALWNATSSVFPPDFRGQWWAHTWHRWKRVLSFSHREGQIRKNQSLLCQGQGTPYSMCCAESLSTARVFHVVGDR